MNTPNVTIAKCVRGNQLTHSEPPRKLENKKDAFFIEHSTIRRIAAFLPLILGGASVVEKMTSYKFLPSGFFPSVVFCMILGISRDALAVENSLQNKKIERLN